MDWTTLFIGILAGWLTKAPFLYKIYKEIRAEREHIEEIVERHKKSLNEKQ